MTDLPEMLRPNQAARILRVSPATVARWAKQGKLPAHRTLGKHRRFRRDDVLALLAEIDEEATA